MTGRTGCGVACRTGWGVCWPQRCAWPSWVSHAIYLSVVHSSVHLYLSAVHSSVHLHLSVVHSSVHLYLSVVHSSVHLSVVHRSVYLYPSVVHSSVYLYPLSTAVSTCTCCPQQWGLPESHWSVETVTVPNIPAHRAAEPPSSRDTF